MIETEAESELMAACHTNVLLLQQIFVQAQKWHLDLGKNNIKIIVFVGLKISWTRKKIQQYEIKYIPYPHSSHFPPLYRCGFSRIGK